MKRPKLRKSSKRMSCHKRYKIQKKVREHKRKARKEAKKTGQRKSKKDINVPNDAPFKEDILREAELRKQRREELKAAQKLERQKEVAKKRKLKDKAEKRDAKQADKKEKKSDAKSKQIADKNSAKNFCMEVNKVIKASDIVLEVLDARDPLGSRCLQAEQDILQAPDKKLLLVLNKIDLVPKDNIEKWLSMLNKELPTIAFKCSAQVQEKNLPSTGPKPKPGCIDISKGTVCHGADSLLRILHGLCPSPNKAIKVGLIGFSNVGKSSLINSLKQYRVCNVGSLKGTTRVMQEVNIDEKIRIIDSPSLVASTDNSPVTLITRNMFQKEDDILKPVQSILKHCDKQQTMLRFNISDYRTPSEFLDLLARRRTLLKKGGVADVEAAARLFLNDWMGARLNYYTQPPASFISHIDNNQTSDACKGIDLDALNQDNKRIIKALKSPGPASCIAFHFSHMTNGVINETELEEENPEPEEHEFDDQEESEEEEDDEKVENDEHTEEKDKEVKDNVEKNVLRQRKVKSSAKKSVPPKELACKSVQFDKTEDNLEDAYDFNTDFN
ncbi:guanine nucleotide-binding protein-like 3 [Gastrophryne carolinensis]